MASSVDRVLTHAGAFAMLKGAIAMAAEQQVPASIAIVDAAGRLLAFIRLDGAPATSVEIAIAKAVAAAAGSGGGVPVVVEERVLGGVGVDAGRAEHDALLARAAVACLQTGGPRPGVR